MADLLDTATLDRIRALGAVWEAPGGDVVLINADCLEVLPLLPDGVVDCVITDPPYGIAEKWNGQQSGKRGTSRLWDGNNDWDSAICQTGVDTSIAMAEKSIVWGGNYYVLPPSRGYLIWDKVQKFSNADSEYAWCSWGQTPRTFRMSRIDAHQNIERGKVHPTQKPVALIAWCLGFLPDANLIIDPFIGSGTTAVACLRTGRRCIGIELDPKYFKIAVNRCKDEIDRTALFAGVESVEVKRQRELLPV